MSGQVILLAPRRASLRPCSVVHLHHTHTRYTESLLLPLTTEIRRVYKISLLTAQDPPHRASLDSICWEAHPTSHLRLICSAPLWPHPCPHRSSFIVCLLQAYLVFCVVLVPLKGLGLLVCITTSGLTLAFQRGADHPGGSPGLGEPRRSCSW